MDKKIIKELLEIEKQSINSDKEILGIVCNNDIIKLKNGKNEIDTFINPKKISSCQNPILFHSHKEAFSDPSEKDKKFNSMFSKSCILGIDGISCLNHDGKIIEKIEWDLGLKVIQAKQIFCDQILGKKYFCEINTNDSANEKILGIFNHLNIKSSIVISPNKDSDIFIKPKNAKCIINKNLSCL